MEENESVYLCKSWMIWHQCFFYWIMNRTCTVFYTEKWIANFLKEMDEEEESLDDESDKEKDVKSENKVSPNQTKHVPWWMIARWWCDNEDEDNAPWRMTKWFWVVLTQEALAKPPYSYVAMIAMAINESGENKLKLCQVRSESSPYSAKIN